MPVHVEGELDTIMAGLRCADPSIAAWPAILRGIDAFMTVDDERVLAAMEMLSSAPPGERIGAGPSGACGAASLIALGWIRGTEGNPRGVPIGSIHTRVDRRH